MKKQKSKNKILGGTKEFYFYSFVFFITIYFLFSTTVTLAQFNLPSIGSIKPTISLASEPLTPLPNSSVTVTANLSGMIMAGDSSYTWFLNGVRQTENSGLNKKSFTFRTGAIGAIYRISVSVVTPQENLSDAINFTVSDVDLTWIANSKAPITYKAKLMPTQNSFVTVSALPFAYAPGTKTKINPGNLIYNWKLDGKLDTERSGINKSSYSFRASNFFGNSHIIRLEVKNGDNTISLRKDVVIPIIRPQIWLYFSDVKTSLPVGAALKNLTAKPMNFSFVAQTYFFNALEKGLNWQWVINNAEVNSEGANPWLATLNLKDKNFEQFSTKIQVTAKNPSNELESAQSITNLEIK